MLKKLVASALYAGLAAGLIVAALQLLLTVPVILEAEKYETGVLTHFAGAGHNIVAGEHGDQVAAENAESSTKRSFLTILATVAAQCGFALVLVAGFAFVTSRGHAISPRTGLIWGIAGFFAFHLLPAAGLSPELPGSAAADLGARQIWWAATVAASIGGLALIGYGRNWAIWGAGIALLALPHVLGAPQPWAFAGVVPPELAADFAGKALAVAAVGWAVLGFFTAYFWQREGALT